MRADVVVVGGGLVGAAFAESVAGAGVRVALVTAERPAAAGPEWDTRIYAISPGSRDFLASIHAWQALDAARIEPVVAMAVHGDRPGAAITFDALDRGVPALAYIAESGALVRAIWARLEATAQVAVVSPAWPVSMRLEAHQATLGLTDGSTISASLVVGADGADSWVRTAAGIGVLEYTYAQRAVVANFRCALPHGGIARQWFRSDGVLALLPLPGPHVSMVWSAHDQIADELLEVAPDVLAARVAEAAGGALGELVALNAPVAFPLKARVARRFVAPRLALIGDAAHNLHPLAGQGVNLGFRDARILSEVIGARGPERDLGVLPLLRRYERARREDVEATLAVTDGLHRLFSSRLPGAAWLRNSGLKLTASLPFLKGRLAQHALG
jgi:ubiquinone biosynthesis UbiH/UbiF/VisC/COQ6 family hydroxylase